MTTLLAQPPAPVDDLTRRQVIAGALAAGGLFVAGCGRKNERDDGSAPTTPATRQVTDFFGNPVEVPNEPQRIVTADDISLGNLLDLGVKPVATAVNLLSVPSFLGRRVDGIEDISTADGIRVNVERLAALRPELIFTIGVDSAKETYEKLRAVAPTFATPMATRRASRSAPT